MMTPELPPDAYFEPCHAKFVDQGVLVVGKVLGDHITYYLMVVKCAETDLIKTCTVGAVKAGDIARFNTGATRNGFPYLWSPTGNVAPLKRAS